ncbi:hypothetical protein [Priestia flexa]|uniref:hypothetical protein n=1 Tax=Priestia flexa TaxID=86664 RepID=UPI002E1E971C|nr:hypothetical protein [Priestia flexa]
MTQESTGSLRVRVRKEYLPLYKDLLKRKIFKEHNEFFTFCCCIGKDHLTSTEKIPLVELCHAYTFKEDQRTLLKALIYNQTQEVVAVEQMFSTAEILADNGFHKLTTSVLEDYVLISEDGDVSLMLGKEKDVQIALSKYVSQDMVAVPF